MVWGWGWGLGFSVLAVVCVLVECVGDLVSDVFGLGGDAGGGHWFLLGWLVSKDGVFTCRFHFLLR